MLCLINVQMFSKISIKDVLIQFILIKNVQNSLESLNSTKVSHLEEEEDQEHFESNSCNPEELMGVAFCEF